MKAPARKSARTILGTVLVLSSLLISSGAAAQTGIPNATWAGPENNYPLNWSYDNQTTINSQNVNQLQVQVDVPGARGASRAVPVGRGSDGHAPDLRGGRIQRDELAPGLRAEPGERERRLVCRPSVDGQLLLVPAAVSPRAAGNSTRPLPCNLPDDRRSGTSR